jgi:hypothetical protein
MSGNVLEWQDSCDQNGGARENDICAFRGGSYGKGGATDQACGAAYTAARNAAFDDVGFRCCWP